MSRLTLLPTTPEEAYRTRRLPPWVTRTWSPVLRSWPDSPTGNLIRARVVSSAVPSHACLVDGRRRFLNRHLEAVIAIMDREEKAFNDPAFQFWTVEAVRVEGEVVVWRATIPVECHEATPETQPPDK